MSASDLDSFSFVGSTNNGVTSLSATEQANADGSIIGFRFQTVSDLPTTVIQTSDSNNVVNTMGGYGLVVLAHTLYLSSTATGPAGTGTEPSLLILSKGEYGLGSGGDAVLQWCFNAVTSGSLRATLVFNDVAAEPTAGIAAVNNLDLILTNQGQTYFPNGKNVKDQLNNVEKIMINNAVSGQWCATVTVRKNEKKKLINK